MLTPLPAASLTACLASSLRSLCRKARILLTDGLARARELVVGVVARHAFELKAVSGAQCRTELGMEGHRRRQR